MIVDLRAAVILIAPATPDSAYLSCPGELQRQLQSRTTILNFRQHHDQNADVISPVRHGGDRHSSLPARWRPRAQPCDERELCSSKQHRDDEHGGVGGQAAGMLYLLPPNQSSNTSSVQLANVPRSRNAP